MPTSWATCPWPAFNEFLDEVEPIEAARVPATFRDWLVRESDRPERDHDPDQEAPRIALGHRAGALRYRRAPSRGRTPAPKKRAKKAAAGTKAAKPRRRSGPPKLDVGGAASPEKRKVIERICMARLNDATEKGLAEMVLIAGCGGTGQRATATTMLRPPK